MAWSFYSENHRVKQKINVDMLRAIRLIEQLSGEQLVFISDFDNNPVKQKKINNSLKERIEKQEKEIYELKKQIKELKELIENK